jgi:hypothetical protein
LGVTDNVSPFMFVMLGWIIMLVDLKLCSIVQKAHMRVLAQLAEKERKLRKKHGDQEIAVRGGAGRPHHPPLYAFGGCF